MRRPLVIFFCLILWLIRIPVFSHSGHANVTTQRYDNYRSGVNSKEAILTPSNVNVNKFGKLFSRTVSGQIYAQPLYLSHVTIPGKGQRNLVFVATEDNNVYAFDADDPNASAPIWQVKLGTPVPNKDVDNAQDIKPNIGITSTPVIDPATNTIYLVAKSKDGSNYPHHLHALDVATGQHKSGSPVRITASVPGNQELSASPWYSSNRGTLNFNSRWSLQRPSLLLLNGIIYIAFGSHGDRDPYHGWVLGYNATTLKQELTYCTTPYGKQGAVWQSGLGLSTDNEGNIYLITGNGTFNANTGGSELGQSYIKLSPSLSVLDWFTPCNYGYLNTLDLDLGSTGALVIPSLNMIVGGGKGGYLYVLNKNNMGRYQSSSDCGSSASDSSKGDKQIIQKIGLTAATRSNGHIHGTPVYWNGPNGEFMYVWAESDKLKQFKLSGDKFSTTPFATSTMSAQQGMPGAGLIISDFQGNGIVWANMPFCASGSSCNAGEAVVGGILRAFDAKDVSKELWNSRMNSSRDDLGNYAKFNHATVVNGKVYVPTFSNKLVVYGLLDGGPTDPTTFDIPLKKGWNMISLPLQPADTSISSVLNNINGKYTAVHAFDPVINNYVSYYPGVTDSPLKTMESGRGYWLYMDQPATLTISGSNANKTSQLKFGWNLAGYSNTSSTNITTALAPINGKFSAVYYFDTEINNYKRYLPGSVDELGTLDPGKGYWIYATEDVTWTLP